MLNSCHIPFFFLSLSFFPFLLLLADWDIDFYFQFTSSSNFSFATLQHLRFLKVIFITILKTVIPNIIKGNKFDNSENIVHCMLLLMNFLSRFVPEYGLLFFLIWILNKIYICNKYIVLKIYGRLRDHSVLSVWPKFIFYPRAK